MVPSGTDMAACDLDYARAPGVEFEPDRRRTVTCGGCREGTSFRSAIGDSTEYPFYAASPCGEH